MMRFLGNSSLFYINSTLHIIIASLVFLHCIMGKLPGIGLNGQLKVQIIS